METKAVRRFKNISEILSLAVIIIGSSVLVGWVFNITVLKSVFSGLVAMKANTAVCFILIGLTLWLSQEKRKGNIAAIWIARISAVMVFLIGFLTFLEYTHGYNFGIDQFLFNEPAGAILTSSPGRMAFNASILFSLIGAALLAIDVKVLMSQYFAQIIVIISGLVALLSIVGYMYGASPLYLGSSLRFSTAIAIHTSIGIIFLCIAYLLARPEKALMRPVSSEGFGGIMIRRILPIVIVVPLTLGWIKIRFEQTTYFSREFGVALVALGNLFVTGIFVYVLSVYLNKLDAERKSAQCNFEDAYNKLNITQKNLIQSEKESALGRFSAGVAHEVRNPLAIIIGSADYLEAKLKDSGEDIKENVERVKNLR